jgi:hypothetical protein
VVSGEQPSDRICRKIEILSFHFISLGSLPLFALKMKKDLLEIAGWSNQERHGSEGALQLRRAFFSMKYSGTRNTNAISTKKVQATTSTT